MRKIKIFTPGKKSFEKELAEYAKRLTSEAQILWVYPKDLAALEKVLAKEKSYICLDPTGKQYSSEGFAKFLETQSANIVFVIGGDEGFTPTIQKNASALISLSKMTFTHHMTRLILAEQIYRAIMINSGRPYHK
ncbi:MAG: 23S rRNA (pseudouridine(1915)-N(3))-methyltransferase RlmH [Candidatus Algichlamydia australiensis]|nr:23S rRNA (pseudouridine(1915)-N(3))-methyltransferase RlmH [Chlamydiales bacterium]